MRHDFSTASLESQRQELVTRAALSEDNLHHEKNRDSCFGEGGKGTEVWWPLPRNPRDDLVPFQRMRR